MIAIGSDHGGFRLKEAVKEHLLSRGEKVLDVGCFSEESCDYPDIAQDVSEKILSGEADCGILCCGTGIGISIAANKIRGIRAAVVSEPVSARLAKEHNNANILCLGGRIVGEVLACAAVDAWMSAEFSGGRHKDRVDKITEIEGSSSV